MAIDGRRTGTILGTAGMTGERGAAVKADVGAASTVEPGPDRATGLLIVLQSVLMLVPVVVLGGAINWPASLDEPASVILPLILEQRGAVAVGYSGYLLASLLLIPIAILLRQSLAGASASLLAVAAAFGALAGVLKLLGIVRWLVLMPALAEGYTDPATSPAGHEGITLLYDAFNRYAGGVGENLGVMLFSGVFTALVAVALLRRPARAGRKLPAWVGWSGLAVAVIVLAGLLEVFGADTGPLLTVSGTAWQLWFLAVAVLLLSAGATGRAARRSAVGARR